MFTMVITQTELTIKVEIDQLMQHNHRSDCNSSKREGSQPTLQQKNGKIPSWYETIKKKIVLDTEA